MFSFGFRLIQHPTCIIRWKLTFKIWWLLKEPFCEWWNIQDTSLVESCLELHWQQLPLSPHVDHDRDVAPKSFATDNLQISHRFNFLVAEDEVQFPRVDLFQFCYRHRKSRSVLRGQPARRKAQAMLHLFSFIVWRTWSYCSCMLARLWVLVWMSAVCWCCCCDAGGSSCGAGWFLCRTSTRSSAMTFFAFKRRLSRFLTTSSLFRTRLASSSASFSHSSSNAASSCFCSCWFWKAWPTLL